MAGMDVTIISTMTDDYNKQNAVAVGLASGTSNVELPNLQDASGANIKIDASDGLSPGELYAVGRSASNTETKDQALTITPQKMDSVLKSIERDAKA